MGGYILRADAAQLQAKAASVDCVVTSPPYNVGISYAGVNDELSLEDHRARAVRWTQEIAILVTIQSLTVLRAGADSSSLGLVTTGLALPLAAVTPLRVCPAAVP